MISDERLKELRLAIAYGEAWTGGTVARDLMGLIDAQSAQLKRAREALERLIPRFEACAHAHGNDRDVVKDASSDARAVLSDLQRTEGGT